jgi:hypothetical protein
MRVGRSDIVPRPIACKSLDWHAEFGGKDSGFAMGECEAATHLRISLADDHMVFHHANVTRS